MATRQMPPRAVVLVCAMLGAALAGCSSFTAVPVQFAEPGIFLVVPATVKGVSTTFLLDTGSTNTIVSKQFADRIGLKGDVLKEDFPIAADVPEEIRDGEYTAAPTLKVGPIRVRRNGGHLLIGDLANVKVLGGEELDGILGNDILGSADYILNAGRPSLTVARNLRLSESAAAHDLTVSGYQTYLPVTINGKSFDFLLDTGANLTQVTPAVLDALAPAQTDVVELRHVTISSSELKKSQWFRAVVKMGDVQVPDFSLLVGDRNVAGLDLLRRGELSVSVRQRKFVFREVDGS